MRSLVLCLFLLAGCSQVYTPPAGYLQMPGNAAQGATDVTWSELCRMPWADLGQPLRLRQTVVWEAGEQSQVMQGMMRLDWPKAQVRIVGLSELGMKLFDLTVDPQAHDVHALSPVLGASRRALAGQVARSVRRIFLPHPAFNEARMYVGPDSALLVQGVGRETVVSACPPQGGLVRHAFSPGMGWEVDFMEYQSLSDILLPTRIEYQDHRGGYRLIMLLHKDGAQ